MSSTTARQLEPLRNDPLIEAAYEQAPEGVRCELLDGLLVMGPRPRTRHARVGSRLGGLLRPFDDPARGEPGGWVILDEPELHLGERPDKLGPDLAGWRAERMPEIPDTAHISMPPDWVCEVLSDSTEVTDRRFKMPIYEREGVAHVWLITPADCKLEVFALQHDRLRPLVILTGDRIVSVEPFERLPIDLGRLWSMRASG